MTPNRPGIAVMGERLSGSGSRFAAALRVEASRAEVKERFIV